MRKGSRSGKLVDSRLRFDLLTPGSPAMRRHLIAGNWKMNMDRAGGVALAKGIAERAGEVPNVDLLVCPPSVYIAAGRRRDQRARGVAVGGQNMYHEASGAFTGEISAGDAARRRARSTSSSATASGGTSSTRPTPT